MGVLRSLALLIFAPLIAACDPPKGEPAEATAPAAAVAAAPPAPAPATPSSPQKVALSPETARLAVVSVNPGAAWAENAYYPDAGLLEGKAWGSMVPGDAAKGAITATFTVPAGATRLALPVATGPGPGAKKIHVLGADRAPLLTLDNPPVIATWKPYEFSVPAGTTTIIVEAEDTGDAWGQWIAFGNPYQVAAAH